MSDATDAAVKLAAEHDIDLADVAGTGADGRITKGDVETHVAALAVAAEAEGAAVSATAAVPAEDVAASSPEDEPETAVPAAADVRAQTPTDDPTAVSADFLTRVQAADNLQALIALGSLTTDEAERAVIRARAKELLKP